MNIVLLKEVAIVNKKLIVIGIIVLVLVFTGFVAFEKYFGSLKSEVPGKWDLISGDDGCFTEVRFFGSGESKSLKLYEGPEDDRISYNGKYDIEDDLASVELIKGEEIMSFTMEIDQVSTDELNIDYHIDDETYICEYEHGVVEK